MQKIRYAVRGPPRVMGSLCKETPSGCCNDKENISLAGGWGLGRYDCAARPRNMHASRCSNPAQMYTMQPRWSRSDGGSRGPIPWAKKRRFRCLLQEVRDGNHDPGPGSLADDGIFQIRV